MLNYQDRNTDTLVQRAGQLPPGVQSFSLPRGNVVFGVQFCQGSTLTAAPTGTTAVWFGLKGQADMKGAWLANVQLQPITGSPGLYQAVLPVNTPEMIAATHADPADTTPEVLALLVYGQVYYFLPGVSDPQTCQLINVTITPVLWTGTEGIAPSPNPPYPSSAALTAAVAASYFQHIVHDNPEKLGLSTSPTPAIVVAGGTVDGTYKEVGTNAGKPIYVLVGSDQSLPNNDSVLWNGVGWHIHDDDGNDTYYSLDAVATPDLCTTWYLTAYNTVAALSVTAITLPGLVPGHQCCLRGEGNRLEQLGPVLDDTVAGCTVSGSGVEAVNRTYYLLSTTPPQYASTRSQDWDLLLDYDETGASAWVAFDAHVIRYYGTPTTYPWQAVWRVAPGPDGGALPVPVVTRNDVASDANWTVLLNTVELTVLNETGEDITINGILVPNGDVVDVGYVDPTSINTTSPGIFQFFQISDNFGSYCQFSSMTAEVGTPFALPLPMPPRNKVLVTLVYEQY